MKKTKVSFSIPMIVCAEDYHDAKEFAQTLSGLTKTKIKAKELTQLFDGDYYHVLYVDKIPTSEEISELRKEGAFCL
jgi:hypothetical protein